MNNNKYYVKKMSDIRYAVYNNLDLRVFIGLIHECYAFIKLSELGYFNEPNRD
jgi:hypothetical protein